MSVGFPGQFKKTERGKPLLVGAESRTVLVVHVVQREAYASTGLWSHRGLRRMIIPPD